MTFADFIEIVGRTIDAAGVGIMVVGMLIASGRFLARWRGGDSSSGSYRLYRQSIGRAILLGLELLVASDIIRSIAVDPSFTSVGVLGLIVLVRTFLSFSLEVELEGRWPWARANQTPAEITSEPEGV